MPTIGWFEILIVVGIAIVVLGPKDFPIMLKKAGSWIGPAKRYVNNIQNEVSNLEIDEQYIYSQMKRRQMGFGRSNRMKIEKDFPKICSGIRHSKTSQRRIFTQVLHIFICLLFLYDGLAIIIPELRS